MIPHSLPRITHSLAVSFLHEGLHSMNDNVDTLMFIQVEPANPFDRSTIATHGLLLWRLPQIQTILIASIVAQPDNNFSGQRC